MRSRPRKGATDQVAIVLAMASHRQPLRLQSLARSCRSRGVMAALDAGSSDASSVVVCVQPAAVKANNRITTERPAMAPLFKSLLLAARA
jgi:hypothetical protein